MTSVKETIERNINIVNHANQLRKFTHGWEKYPFLEDEVLEINSLISDFANEAYSKDKKDVTNMCVLYSIFIIKHINKFIMNYCDTYNLDYEDVDRAVLVEGNVVNPVDGIGNIYNQLTTIRRKTAVNACFRTVGRLLLKL